MMTKQEYLKFHKAACMKMIDITQRKNSDYTGTSSNPFANFENIGRFGKDWILKGFLTRMDDKMSRIASYVQKGILEVKDESVEDTLFDLGNYCILLAGYIRSLKGKK